MLGERELSYSDKEAGLPAFSPKGETESKIKNTRGFCVLLGDSSWLLIRLLGLVAGILSELSCGVSGLLLGFFCGVLFSTHLNNVCRVI